MQQITIKALGPEDAQLLLDVPEGLFDLPTRVDQTEAFLNNSDHYMVAAFVGDLMVGMASGVVNLHPDKDPALFVNEVGVRDEWQRKGIATRLMNALFDLVKPRGITGIWLATEIDNDAARGLYKHMNARETKGIVVYDWGGAMDI